MLACITLFTIASNCFDAIVRFINDNDYSTWTAANNQFSNWTLASITSILSQIPLDGIADPFQPNITLPSDFDAKQKWPSSIHPVRNQNNCGSCWAFALTGMMSDRFAIAGCPRGVLSPQDLVSCDTNDHGCNGGQFNTSLHWAITHGVATDKCIPYSSGNGAMIQCPTHCRDRSSIIRFKGKSYHHLNGNEIQEAIFERGPIEVGMAVYFDFMFYHHGVYKHHIPLLLGYHAVRCIGWGVDTTHNLPYWLCVNSWGLHWGEHGTFRIVRGTNECKLEANAYELIVGCDNSSAHPSDNFDM